MGAVFSILLVGLLSQKFLTFFQSLSLTCIGIFSRVVFPEASRRESLPLV